jgi:hypothetical protein
MLSEYITHVVRSIVACDIMSRRNLAEIMAIPEAEFDELFGRPAVSSALELRHVEALTRFFGCRLYDVGFLATVGNSMDDWRRSRRGNKGGNLLQKLSSTADTMLMGGSEDYGKNSNCSSSAVAESKGYSEMIDRCMGMAFVVGVADADQPEEAQETKDSMEEAVA